MVFNRIPTEFLLGILCALTTLLLHFHDAHNVGTVLSQRLHCFEDTVTSQRMPYNLRAKTTDTTTAFAQRPLCTFAELLLHCRRPQCAAMATLRRPHCTLIRMPSNSICFEHAKVCSVIRHSIRSHSAY